MTAAPGQVVGGVWVEVLASASRFGEQLEREIGPQVEQAGRRGGDDYSAGFSDSAERGLSSRAKGILKGFSVAAGAAIAAGVATAGAAVVKSLDNEKITDRMTAALGATPKVAARYGKVAANLYAGAWGESMADVTGAVESVSSSFRDLGNKGELQRVTRQALDFAAIFETDVPRAAQVASTVMQSGLAKSATEAFDLMTAASQRVPAALRGDVLDAAEEYAGFFDTLGLTGEQAFGILAEGSEKGIYGIDKAGDAIKEFTIRATDMSTASKDAYQAIGLNAGDMARDILAGGDTANGAFGKVLDGLLSIEDPAKRANNAIALFGTPLEDLGVKDIPAFLKSLQAGTKGMKDWEGSIDSAGKTLNDNAATNLESFKRQVSTGFVNLIGGQVLPGLSKFAKVLANVFGPDIRRAMAFVESDLIPAARRLIAAFSGEQGRELLGQYVTYLRGQFDSLLDIVGSVVDIATALWENFGSNIVQHLRSTFTNIMGFASGLLTAVRGLFDVVAGILTGDWGRVWDGAKGIVSGAWKVILAIIKQAWNNIRFAFKNAGVILTAIVSALWTGLKKLVQIGVRALVDYVKNLPKMWGAILRTLPGLLGRAMSAAWNAAEAAVSKGISTVVSLVSNLPGAIRDLGGKMLEAGKTLIGRLFDGISSAARSAGGFVADIAASVKEAINNALNLPLTISFHKGPIDIEATLIPRFATGGRVNSATYAMIGEGGEAETVFPDSVLGSFLERMTAAATANLGGGTGRNGQRVFLVLSDGTTLDGYIDERVTSAQDLLEETGRAKAGAA